MAKRTKQPALPGMEDTWQSEQSDLTDVASSQSDAGTGFDSSGIDPSGIDDEPLVPSGCESAASPPPESLNGKTVYVVDANSLIFQVFHAIPEMTSPAGQPVNAVFGFTRDLLWLIEKKKPDYLFCAFDLPGPTFRHERYNAYKATRSEMPDDLAPQFDSIHRMIDAMNIPLVCLDAYEADDVLATLGRRTEELGGDCYLVSGDKDCRQLITDHVKVYNVRKDEVFDTAALVADWGIRPDQVVDFQALVGDSVDNVPGVARIGPKTARELLQKYGTLDRLYHHVDEITGAKKNYLIEGRENAFLSRELVRLENAVPVPIDWTRGQVGSFNVDRVLNLCGEFGFHRIAEQIRSMDVGALPEAWEADYRLVDTPEKFATFLEELKQQKLLSFDTETTDVAATRADIVGYSFAWEPGVAWYVAVRGPEGEAKLDPQSTLEALRPVLESPDVKKLGQNLKYDLLVLRRAGVVLRGLKFDTMLASYLLEAGERNHNLDELATRYLKHTNISITSLIGTGKNQKRMDEVPIAKVAEYAAEDADVPMRLLPILDAKLRESNVDKLFAELEVPLVEVLAEMEHHGITVDLERLKTLSDTYGERLKTLEAEIYGLAGHEFNIASPKQLQQVLFVEQGLRVVSKTKTGASTDVDVLEELAREHPLPARIIEYRQYAKLKGTYVDALPTMVNPATGRVHTSFHQAVAATGRLSSNDPNLQNIPIRTEAGREIRSAFLAGEKDWLLLAADYSQIELRVLAHFSGDETMSRAFADDEDIHTFVAAQVYNVAHEAVTREQRRAAKAVNFGIIYGQSPFGLAKALDIEQAQAAEFINAYFERYPGVDKFMSKILEDARQQGYVTTVLGRRRAIRGIRPRAPRQRNLSERTAINTVIQGSAADLIKRAMIGIHERLRREGLRARMLLQIHDELMFEVPQEEVDTLGSLVVDEMSNVLKLDVPLKVDVKTGRNWAETEPWN